jgi:hypothetical protein
MAKFRTYYDSLNVSRNAPASVIKAAYKALCQKYHPDKYIGGHEEALRIMKAINGAYAVLSDSGKRAAHDQWIGQQERDHATSEAQRIMEIITKNYVAPIPVNDNPNPPVSYREIANKLRAVSSPILRRLSWVLGFTVAVGIIYLVIVFYLPDFKITAPVNQDVTAILKKAQHTLNKGQVLKALPLYLQLAEQGNADAQFHVGMIYTNGQGVTRDDKQASDWFSKAAEQGHREAQTKLGFMYATGKGVAQNYSLANFWCYQAAKQGDATAQYNLGLMYEKGQGVAQDNNLAVSWYSKAAVQGHAHAQYNLGVMYANGAGVVKDNKQAAALYRKAAAQGLAEAIVALKQLDR